MSAKRYSVARIVAKLRTVEHRTVVALVTVLENVLQLGGPPL